MNCRGSQQRFLPLSDLSRKIEGGTVCRVPQHLHSSALKSTQPHSGREQTGCTRAQV